MRASLAIVLASLLVFPNCAGLLPRAATRGPALRAGPQLDPQVLAEYIAKLPVGSGVRVRLKDGRTVNGTLLTVEADRILVQQRTREPEPPEAIAIDRISMVEIDQGRGIGKQVAIGMGAALGSLLLWTMLTQLIYGGY